MNNYYIAKTAYYRRFVYSWYNLTSIYQLTQQRLNFMYLRALKDMRADWKIALHNTRRK